MKAKRENIANPGLSKLSKKQLKDNSGKCVGIIDGKLKFSNKSAKYVLKQLIAYEDSEDKVFSCIPKHSNIVVK